MLIIARYTEDISWARDFGRDIIIYNKGDRATIPEDLQEFVTDLPNVGRESHTYLKFITDNYTKIDPDKVYTFTQGRWNDHNVDLKKLQEIPDGLDHSRNLLDSTVWGRSCMSAYDFRIAHYIDDYTTPTIKNENYGEWYTRVVQQPFPHYYFYVYPNAIFALKGSAILRYPRELYIRLLEEVDKEINPEAGHYIERTWSKLFAMRTNIV